MVSKASEDLPLAESPVTTTIKSRGSETVMSLRLCSRARRTTIWLSAIFCSPLRFLDLGKYTASFQEAKGSIRPWGDFIIRGGLFSPKFHPKAASYIFREAW